MPWVPAISILINVNLMLQLSGTTWLQFAIWIVLGKYGWYASKHLHGPQRQAKAVVLNWSHNIETYLQGLCMCMS